MVYVFLADGFEEIEALTTVDVLRRAGIPVKCVGVNTDIVTGAHGIKVLSDIELSNIILDEALSAVVLPGGMPGALHLFESEAVLNAATFANNNNKTVAAICAAPFVLGELGLLNGKKATCYPGFESHLKGALLQSTPVTRDGNIITANGPAAATAFAREILSAVDSKEKADAVLKDMLWKE